MISNSSLKMVQLMNNQTLSASHYKLRRACRNQVEFQMCSLDERLPQGHKARVIWDFVEEMNTSECLEYIKSFHGSDGRSTIDPKILLALWIYSILDGNSSARRLEELSISHDVYKWICGGVSINRTMLAEFRSHNPRKFDTLLTSCLAAMVKAELINDEDFSQDGTRVKANAGMSSFRREDSLKKLEEELTNYIKQLKLEELKSPKAYEERNLAAKERALLARKERVKEALKNLEEARSEKVINGASYGEKPTPEDLIKVRASTTDPDVRKMKMGDGGFRLAYNVQFATGLDSRVIYGVDVVKTLDPGTSPKLMSQVYYRLKKLNLREIKSWIADAAYSAKRDITGVAELFPNCLYYAPPKLKKGQDPKIVKRNDSEAVKKWRGMIGEKEVEEIYKKRSSTAEFSNMQVKNQALKAFSVRGLAKVKGMALLHAIAQNISRYCDLIEKKVKDVML